MNATLTAGTKVRMEMADGTVGPEMTLSEDVAVEVVVTSEVGSVYTDGDKTYYVESANEEA